MSFTAVTKAVAKVVSEAKLQVVDDLMVFLDSKIDMDDDLKAFFTEFKDAMKEKDEKTVKAVGKKGKKGVSDEEEVAAPKKKRAPSIFNLYVKDVMPLMREKNPDIKDGKKLIAMASEEWKTDPMAKFIKEKVVELKESDKESDVHDLYAKAKALYSGSDQSDAAKSDDEEEKPKPTKTTKPAKAPAAKGGKGKKGKKEEIHEEELSADETD